MAGRVLRHEDNFGVVGAFPNLTMCVHMPKLTYVHMYRLVYVHYISIKLFKTRMGWTLKAPQTTQCLLHSLRDSSSEHLAGEEAFGAQVMHEDPPLRPMALDMGLLVYPASHLDLFMIEHDLPAALKVNGRWSHFLMHRHTKIRCVSLGSPLCGRVSLWCL